MTSYYVRKNGNDTTGNGSSAAPWLTVAKGVIGIGAAGGPHTLNIGAGAYAENSSGGYLTFQDNYATPRVIQSESGNADDVQIYGASNATYNFFLGASGSLSNNITFQNLTFINRAATNTYIFRFVNTALTTFTNCKFLNSGNVPALYFAKSGASTIAGVTFNNCIVTSLGAGIVANDAANGTQDLTINNCVVSGVGAAASFNSCTNININGGSYTSTTNYGLVYGADGGNISTAITCTGSIKNATIQSNGGTGHTLLIAGHADSIEVSGCTIIGNVYTLILKECSNCNVHDNTIVQNFVNATSLGVYFKGSTGNTVTRNKITKSTTGAAAVYAAPGDTGHKCQNNIFTYNTVICTGTAALFSWPVAADDGGLVCDYNKYRAGTWGAVLGTTVTDMPSLRAAWAGYGDGSNDSHSTMLKRRRKGLFFLS